KLIHGISSLVSIFNSTNMSASTSLTVTSYSMISKPSTSLSSSRVLYELPRFIRSQLTILYPNGRHLIFPRILLKNLILKSFLVSHLPQHASQGEQQSPSQLQPGNILYISNLFILHLNDRKLFV